MYINPVIAGALIVILIEICALLVAAIIRSIRRK